MPNRDKLKKFLKDKKILTYIHYPIPIHRQKAYKKMKFRTLPLPVTELQSKQILSIPVHHNLTNKQLKYILIPEYLHIEQLFNEDGYFGNLLSYFKNWLLKIKLYH